MNRSCNILPFVVLLILSFGCKDRNPINPLDPENSSTQGQPYTIHASVQGIGKVRLHWNRVNQSQVTSYRIYRSTEGGVYSHIADETDTLFIDTKLQPGKAYSYFYRLMWKDSRELHQSPNAMVITFDAPTGFTITNVTRDKVEMRWDDLHWLDNYVRCRIYRGTGTSFSLYDSISSNQYIDTVVDTGITYRYKIVAVANDGSISNFSDEIYATPGNSAPVINSIQLSQPITGWGEEVTITCVASDADGDSIHYLWQALDGGTISGSGSTIIFQVPQDTLLAHRIMVTVSDDYSVGDSKTTVIESAQLALSENFDSYPVGTFPSSGGWRLVWNGAGNSYQVVTNTLSVSPPNSMQMKGQPSWSANMDHEIISGKNVVWVEAKMRISEPGDGGISIWNKEELTWGRRYCSVEFLANGNITVGYYDGVIHGTVISNYDPNRWYKIKVKYHSPDGLTNVWIDDTLKIQNYQALSGGQGYRQVMLSGGWEGKLLYYDNLKIWIQ